MSGALTSGQVNVGNASNVATGVTPIGDVTMTNAGAFSVIKLQGSSVSATTPTTNGQALRWNGSAWAPAFVSMFDLRSVVTGVSAFGGVGCTSGQTLTWTAATDNLSCSSISLPVGQITGTLPATNGGTGQSSFAIGDLLYGSSTTAISRLPAGTNGQVLTLASGVPSWGAASGGLPAAAGTAAAPGYAFSGNTNTGVFGAASNQIGLSTNGSERMRIDASGNVGIGTTNPTSPLSLLNSSTSISNAFQQSLSYAVTPASNNSSTYAGINQQSSYNGTTNNGGLVGGGLFEADFYSSGSGGTLVGSQGTAIAGGAGTILSGYGVSGSIMVVSGTVNKSVGANALSSAIGGTVTNSIGVYGESQNQGGTIVNGYGGKFAVSNSSGTTATGYGVYIGSIAATTKYSLYASDAAAPSYLAGNVGIGTASPSRLLHLSGSTDSVGLKIQNTQAGGASYELQSTGSGDFTGVGALGIFDGTDYYYVLKNGKTSIGGGYPPTQPLSVTSGVTGSPATSGSVQSAGLFRVYTQGTGLDMGSFNTHDFWMQVADTGSLGTTRNLALNPVGGNVGVGTISPAAKLDVSGHVANSGAAAAVGTCGASPAISGNDTRGVVTLGTGGPAACTIVFASAYTTAPYCVITPHGGNPGVIQWWISETTTTLVMTFSAAPTASQQFEYHCMQ